MERHLAQLNIATLRHPMDDPRIADFAEALPTVNGAGEQASGFVWRLQSDTGNATDIQVFDDPLLIVNLTVWESIDALKAFAFHGIHREFFRRRAEWFVEARRGPPCGGSRQRACRRPTMPSCGSTSSSRSAPRRMRSRWVRSTRR